MKRFSKRAPTSVVPLIIREIRRENYVFQRSLTKSPKISHFAIYLESDKNVVFAGADPPPKSGWGVRRGPSRPAGAKIFFREPLKRRRMHFQKPENRKIRKNFRKNSEKIPVL